MHREVIIQCLPWITLLIASVVALRFLVWCSGAKMQLARLRSMHRCERGSVQSLSFVLTLPAFIMIMMFIVQVSQITIGTILVHYSAYASVRSAVVWIPAYANEQEQENCISSFRSLGSFQEDGIEIREFEIAPVGRKYEQIEQAAVLAVLPLAPSHDMGYTVESQDGETLAALQSVYAALDQNSTSNSRIPVRIANKLAYSRANTDVQVRFTHDETGYRDEPDLGYEIGRSYDIGPHHEVYWWNGRWYNYKYWYEQEYRYEDEYQMNELGFRDHVTVTVTHHMALLPGPGRLLSRSTGSDDEISRTIEQKGQAYTWPITASATLGLEGEKSLKRFRPLEEIR